MQLKTKFQRRIFANYLSRIGYLGLVSVVAFCKRAHKSTEIKQASDTPPPSSSPDQNQADKQEPNQEEASNTSEEQEKSFCPTKVAYIDYSNLQDVGEAFGPHIKVYGNAKSAMLVFGLPCYPYTQQNRLRFIMVVRPNGHILATKFIHANADIDGNGNLRPIIFDNINLRGDRSLVFLISTHQKEELFKYVLHSSGQTSSSPKSCNAIYNTKNNLSFVDKNRGNDTISFGMTSTHIPTNFHLKQSFPLFSPNSKNTNPNENFGQSFNSSSKIRYATKSTKYALSENLTEGEVLNPINDTVTDLLGNPINIHIPSKEEEFAQILEYPYYVVYRLANRSKKQYVRTIVRSF